MGASQSLVWKVYTGVLGAVTTIAAQKLVTAGWKLATGDEPPSPTDPDTPFGVAASWAIASAIGVGVVQLATARYTARRFADDVGKHAPDKKLKLKI